MLKIFICLVMVISPPSLAHHPEDHFTHLPTGGRKALHGMVLFGAGPYFLEHIPMLTPPHDFQVIAEVALTDKNGQPLAHDFSNESFTFKPSTTFSLNDYISGRLRKFSGDVYRGSFEQDGQLLADLQEVLVEVVAYKVIRPLPSPSEEPRFILSDGKNFFESNVIRPEKSVQFIRNIGTGKTLWCVQGPDFFDPCP